MKQLDPIQLRFNRVPTAIAAVVFGAAAVMFFDAATFEHIEIDMNPAWIWMAFAGCGATAFMCLKNTVSPKNLRCQLCKERSGYGCLPLLKGITITCA